jgi:hypothetical protein
MQNPYVFDSETIRSLDALGAEPLDGSGFESESPDPEFISGDAE